MSFAWIQRPKARLPRRWGKCREGAVSLATDGERPAGDAVGRSGFVDLPVLLRSTRLYLSIRLKTTTVAAPQSSLYARLK